MSRLDLSMNTKNAILAMSDGNPGAINVTIKLLTENEKVDPESFLGPLTAMSQLDGLGIYGSEIWIMYKDVCGSDLIKLMALLRSNQMGLVSRRDIKHAIEGQLTIDVDAVYRRLREELPSFNSGV